MAINLITGLPGHGKTLYCLATLRDIAAKEGRPVFYNGIKDLALPWTEWAPEKWQELPPNAIFVIDEVQGHLPVRGKGRPAEWIEMLARHRHQGIDFYLITQNPMLMDSFVRRLVDRHFHVVRKFGTKFATIHEFTNGANDNVAKSRAGSITHEWRYPKDVFDLYKSAEVHTVKRRIPMRVWLLLALPFVLGALVWFGYQRLKPDAVAARVSGAAPGASASSAASAPFGVVSPAGAGGAGLSPEPGSAEDVQRYLSMHRPRVAGLQYTAPVYDEATRAVEAPYPAACVSSAKRCQCYTQQGTRLDIEAELCKRISEGGFFVAWARTGQNAQALPGQGGEGHAAPVQVVARSDAGPSVAGFNAGSRYTPISGDLSILNKK